MRITNAMIKNELSEYTHQENLYLEYHLLQQEDPKAAEQFLCSLSLEDLDLFRYENSNKPGPNGKSTISDGYIVLTEQAFQSHDILVIKHPRYSPVFLHMHDFYEILYVYEGHCTNTIQNNVIQLKKGDLCIIPPSSLHYLAVFDDSIVLNLLVRETTFNRIFTNLFHENNPLTQFYFHTLYQREDSNYLLFHTGDDDTFQSIMEDLYEETMHPLKYSYSMIQTYMGNFLVTLMRNHEADLELYIHSKDMKINLADMLIYFQQNYSTLTLEKAAAHFNFSTPYFSKIVKKYTGQNFIQIIHHLKLENACRLLTESDLPMQALCELVGYDSRAHFSRAFKAEYGMAPSEFRELSKK